MRDDVMIRFLVMDVDGTLTDGKIHISENGELFKSFNVKDGWAIGNLLPRLNILPVIITGRESDITIKRCRELKIKEVHQSVNDKLDVLDDILKRYSEKEQADYTMKNVAYIGDDVPDLKCMVEVSNAGGFCACPRDASEEVKKIATFVSTKDGGNGAVREFIEWIQTIR